MTIDPKSARDQQVVRDRAPAIINTLRPTRCAECGYDLRGLPEEGRCPECGYPHSREEIILVGWGVGDRGHPQNARPGRAVFGIIGGLAGLLPMAFLASLQRRWSFIPFLAILLVANGLLITFVLLRRRGQIDRFGAPAQVRLSSRGYVQVNNNPLRKRRDSPIAWTSETDVELVRQHGTCYRLTVYTKPFNWWKLMQSAIDIELGLEDATAAELRSKINEWIARSTAI
jgi:hypothetical protein